MAKYLRSKGVDIHCIKYSYFKEEEHNYIHVDEIIGKEPVVKIGLTENQKKYLDFYNEVAQRFKDKINIQLPHARPISYYKISTGINDVHFEWLFRKNYLGVELHLERKDRKENLNFLRELEKYKEEIERETKEKLFVDDKWLKRGARLYLIKEYKSLDEEVKQWTVDKMEKFYKILKPKLNEIKI